MKAMTIDQAQQKQKRLQKRLMLIERQLTHMLYYRANSQSISESTIEQVKLLIKTGHRIIGIIAETNRAIEALSQCIDSATGKTYWQLNHEQAYQQTLTDFAELYEEACQTINWYKQNPNGSDQAFKNYMFKLSLEKQINGRVDENQLSFEEQFYQAYGMPESKKNYEW